MNEIQYNKTSWRTKRLQNISISRIGRVNLNCFNENADEVDNSNEYHMVRDVKLLYSSKISL